MRRGLAFGAVLVAVVAIGTGFTSSRAEGPATVYAAASLTDVFPKVSPSSRFQFAGSNQLAFQITRGAPADVFASASPIYTQDLYRNGLVGKPRTFATNSLVLAVPRSNPAKIHSVFDLAKRPKLKLVVAGQKVPIGLYTREVLKRLGLLRFCGRPSARNRTSRGSSASSRSAKLMPASSTRPMSAPPRRGWSRIPLPKRSQPTVRYEVAVVTGSNNRESALEFVADLLSTDGRRELAKAGFGLP